MPVEDGLVIFYQICVVSISFFISFFLMYLINIVYHKVKKSLNQPTTKDDIHMLLEISKDVDKRVVFVENKMEDFIARLEEVEKSLHKLETKKKAK